MAQTVEAVYVNGVLKPGTPLNLRESQRVRVTVEPLSESDTAAERSAALDRLRRGIQEMGFRSSGPLPTRQELHDRS